MAIDPEEERLVRAFLVPEKRDLRRRGAGDTCRAISTDREIDGKRLPLGDALARILGRGNGTLLSCVPGVLGCFEGEGPSDRCLLVRPGA